MLNPNGTRLEVWGDPVAHSRSPQLHSAAYRVLGLDWTYERRRVAEASFDAELAGLSRDHRGLSLTMPLKGAAFQAAVACDRRAELTGAVNTLLLASHGPRGFNTDVGGIVLALQEEGVDAIDRARIVGAGATAMSALVALSELGAERVDVIARRAIAIAPLAELGESLGVHVTGVPFEAAAGTGAPVTIATLPGDAPLDDSVADSLADGGGLLLDVVYGHWPTALALAWDRAGGRATSGLGMLLHQALLQVRVFVTGDPDTALDHEDAVLAEMRLAVVGD
ncbi:shikimate dehydrogenase [Microbacterium sp. cf046]|uniref:shikimate dehydrogenase family protein n=1 Tax=Microbacterium sp. cf046 TaxID=1761803 RepID=UPI0008E27813|nr:shikimate dehydrogenase [Microbacterium sp. cf046]SFS04864.1 shikimate dehydrogenase [Microbacterium sp. cf046]